tara:strand:+ start:13655 stop:14452 length:798 start_codon:yes stop_codon:yes gene_type:complete
MVSGETFELRHHQTLDILITHPKPENLAMYYESDAYLSHTDSNKGWFATLYQWVKRYSLKQKVRLIQRFHKGKGSLLDVGAGTGDFLQSAKESGWHVQGVEVSEKARDKAREKDLLLDRSLDEIGNVKFDVITLWHVLEHIETLEATIEQLHDLLSTNGVLIIAVPNFKSYDAQYYKQFWAAFDVPRHLWHFSKFGLCTLLSTKFSLVKTRPMWFDAFYVSLLSEKYKSGHSFSLKAIAIAFWSNVRAVFTKQPSSRIYCFKKAK